ncbi:hypothetical protein [Paraburkholderia bryophila]|uniref:Ferritin-like domain-containing protein n=1 Tax=Paraburkholderia bryophila TaxID=420952 RepID=A0A329CKH0_9BURK|nr:hypothetical protein [Paraburkholderia bryophila]RAS34587.1 hypothetical protein BX591_106268 [Paraburkholderia bryophila]
MSRLAYACLAPAEPRGLAALRAWLVDRIKRKALRRLHADPRGERLVLRMYLAAEDATERALQEELLPRSPAWLTRQLNQHLADERRHVALFVDALQAVGDSAEQRLAPDWLSRRKIARWDRLARRYASHFAQGVLVPVYATGLCAEQMATRVLTRHCDVLGGAHALFPLFASVLADERRHVRLCETTLRRMVAPAEVAALAALMREIRAIEAGYALTGAIAIYLASWAIRPLKRRPESTRPGPQQNRHTHGTS